MDAPVARLRSRQAGERRVVRLDERLGILVEFVVPSPLQELEIDAATDASHSILMRSPQVLARYGFTEASLTQEQASMTYMRIRLQEAAVVLWKDWNVAFTGEAVDPINAETVRDLLADANVRAAWAIYFADACSLERAEGNVSAVSPSTTTGEAANTVEGAESSMSPAAEVLPDPVDDTAPPSKTRRVRRKGSSSSASGSPQG